MESEKEILRRQKERAREQASRFVKYLHERGTSMDEIVEALPYSRTTLSCVINGTRFSAKAKDASANYLDRNDLIEGMRILGWDAKLGPVLEH